jgi:peptidyl-prolyl cis-trans isomerase SurA
MRKAAILTAVLLAAALVFAADTVVEEIVARINGAIITSSDLQRSQQQTVSELRQAGGSLTDQDIAEHEKNVLRDLIDQQLLIQKASDLGITGDTELIKRLDEIRKQMGLDSMEALEKAAEAQGVSYEDFKRGLRNQILTQAVISREVGSHILITTEEAKKYYDSHRSELERPEQVRLSEILVSTQKPAANEGETASDVGVDEIAAAKSKAEALLQEIRHGAKFEDVAKRSSDGPTAAQGGDLGYFKRGTLAKELEDITFAMKPGDVSDVIHTKQGFIVLKVTEHTPAGLPPLKDVEGEIQNAIYLQKLQPALRTYLTKLREDAFIDIKPGYVDTGASPNQTKPYMVAAAGAEENAKKPKKKKKFLIF